MPRIRQGTTPACLSTPHFWTSTKPCDSCDASKKCGSRSFGFHTFCLYTTNLLSTVAKAWPVPRMHTAPASKDPASRTPGSSPRPVPEAVRVNRNYEQLLDVCSMLLSTRCKLTMLGALKGALFVTWPPSFWVTYEGEREEYRNTTRMHKHRIFLKTCVQ